MTTVFCRLSQSTCVQPSARNTFDVCKTQQRCVVKPFKLHRIPDRMDYRLSLIIIKSNCSEDNRNNQKLDGYAKKPIFKLNRSNNVESGQKKITKIGLLHPVETSVVFVLTLPLNAMRPFPPT